MNEDAPKQALGLRARRSYFEQQLHKRFYGQDGRPRERRTPSAALPIARIGFDGSSRAFMVFMVQMNSLRYLYSIIVCHFYGE